MVVWDYDDTGTTAPTLRTYNANTSVTWLINSLHHYEPEQPIRPNLSPSEETSRLPYTLIWSERSALRRAYIRPDRLLNMRVNQSNRRLYRDARFDRFFGRRKKSQPFGRLSAGYDPAR